MMANLSSVWWFLMVILFCISLVISNVEHLYMCLLAICMSSLDKYLPKSSALLFSLSFGLLLLLLLSCFSCSYMQNLNEFVRKKTFIQVERNARMNDCHRGSGSMNIPFSRVRAPQVEELRSSALGPHTHTPVPPGWRCWKHQRWLLSWPFIPPMLRTSLSIF